MIIVTGTIHASPDHLDELLERCIEHVKRSRSEPGCISHHVHQDAQDPTRIFFHEEWESSAALRTHFAVPASGEFVSALAAFAIGRPEMAIYEAERATISAGPRPG